MPVSCKLPSTDAAATSAIAGPAMLSHPKNLDNLLAVLQTKADLHLLDRWYWLKQ